MALFKNNYSNRDNDLKNDINHLLEMAMAEHQNGQLHSAEIKYLSALEIDPDHLTALQLSGLLAFQLQNYQCSIERLSKVIFLKPNCFEAYNNRGIAYFEQKDFKAAIDDYSLAIKINPNYAEAFYNRGLARQELGELDDAIGDYTSALSIKPTSSKIFNNRGIALQQIKQFNNAMSDYEHALSIDPDYAEAHNNLGTLCKEMNLLENALNHYSDAIFFDPTLADAFYNRGITFQKLNRASESLNDFDQALVFNPQNTEALNNRGLILKKLNRYDEALSDLDKALAIKDDFSEAYNNRGNVRFALSRLEDALVDFNKVISLKPDDREAYSNRALVLKDLGRFDEAMADLNKAIALDPTYPEAHWNKALQLLLFGEFEEGWPLFEWRWKTKQHLGTELTTSKPQWSGEANKRVFLWAEQGIGDEIMYASLIPELAASSSKLIVQCDERLIPLFKRSFIDGIEYRCRKSPAPEDSYDCHIPMGSLPNIFRPSLDSFSKASKAYLHCESERSQELRKTLLKGEAKTLIGISWNSSSPIAGAHHRNITLSDMAQHLDAPNVQLVNLQYGDVSDEIAKLKEDHGIEVAEVSEIDNRNDIDGLAALIMACDQIVSIDNATVHLAGALGANTKVLLPFNRSWQWGLDRSDSYWYGSLQLHRQKNYGDWKHVLKTIK
jgi:tetratricopeptide (TPR) repeat protein